MIVFILRHADRDSGANDLNKKGVERSKLLARMLAETGVSVAYRSDAKRTGQTLEPLAQQLGDRLTIKTVPIESEGANEETHVGEIVQSVKAWPSGAVVVVVSHSNTVGLIAKGLGGESESITINEKEFDHLVVLFRPSNSPVNMLKMRYGAKTPSEGE
jgi:phosphohistidine phosphatase SixA